MTEQQQSLETLQHIRKMMDRSSRFLSLSGLSGISAGLAAICGAWAAAPYVFEHESPWIQPSDNKFNSFPDLLVHNKLFWIAVITFITALLSAFIFTWIRTKKEGIPVWGQSSRRFIINTAIPLIIAAAFIYKLCEAGEIALIAPACLLFYGLALVNASKYTNDEVRWLGYIQLLLGLLNLLLPGYGLWCWLTGFGIMHILYGAYMWWKYERKTSKAALAL